MDDLIQSLAAAAKDKDDQNTTSQGADLLGSLLGGLTGASQPQASAGANPLGLLGGLLGGGGSGGLLANLLGGGQSATNPLVSNIAAQLSKKLGIDSTIATMVVTFAINKLLPIITGALTGQAAQAAPVAQAAPAPTPAQSGAGLGGLLQTLMGNRTVTSSYLRSTGLTQELSQQAGIDTRTADRSLKQTFKLLGEQMAGDESMAALVRLLGE